MQLTGKAVMIVVGGLEVSASPLLFFLDIALPVQLTGKAVMIVVGGFEVSASLLVPTTSTPQSSNKPQTTHTCHVKLLPVNIRSPACFLNHFHSSEVTFIFALKHS